MTDDIASPRVAMPGRLETKVPGLDTILGGGLPVARTVLVAGSPGTGKTTLGNQLAFHHAAAGGRVVVATLLAETHDLMLANLASFHFFDPALVGERVLYHNLFDTLESEGLEGVAAAIRRLVRESDATLLVVDGAAVIEDVATSQLALRRFVQQLQVQAAILGVTTLIMTGCVRNELEIPGAHVDGIVVLTNEPVESRQVRQVEVIKLRGGPHVAGGHTFTITESGLTMFPRLESVAGWRPRLENPREGLDLGTGVPGFDTMLGGGVLPFSSTLVMGTPGAGKTLLGLSFLMEGANRGERGLLAGFHETPPDLIATAAGIGLDLRGAIEAGLIRILWDPPLELLADAWAWRLLDVIGEYRPRRLFLDALSDIQSFIISPRRRATYTTALTNELRSRGVTSLFATEIDTHVDDELVVPVPAISATMDNGILLRHVELRSSLHRLVSVLKVRQRATDPAIRGFVITEKGIVVSGQFPAASGLLTGRVDAAPPSSGDAAS